MTIEELIRKTTKLTDDIIVVARHPLAYVEMWKIIFNILKATPLCQSEDYSGN